MLRISDLMVLQKFYLVFVGFMSMNVVGFDGSFVMIPKNVVTVTGKRAKLECRTNSNRTVFWAFKPANGSLEVHIYFGIDIVSIWSSRYKIDKRGMGQHDLIISSADFSHAGRYQCTIFDPEMTRSAELNVLDSEPICNTNVSQISPDGGGVENDYLLMWCQFSYAGNMIANADWRKRGLKKVTTASTSAIRVNGITVMNSTAIIQMQSTDNGKIFHCDITSHLPNTSKENIIEYQYTWNYTVNVLYEPRNITVEPFFKRYIIGDRLRCLADGNPTPTYKWTEARTGRVVEGPELILDETMISKETLDFQCTAENTVAGERKYISWTIEVASCVQRRRPEMIVGGIIGAIGILMLGLSLILTFKAQRKASELKREIPLQSVAERQESEMVPQTESVSDSYASLSTTRFTQQLTRYEQLHL